MPLTRCQARGCNGFLASLSIGQHAGRKTTTAHAVCDVAPFRSADQPALSCRAGCFVYVTWPCHTLPRPAGRAMRAGASGSVVHGRAILLPLWHSRRGGGIRRAGGAGGPGVLRPPALAGVQGVYPVLGLWAWPHHTGSPASPASGERVESVAAGATCAPLPCTGRDSAWRHGRGCGAAWGASRRGGSGLAAPPRRSGTSARRGSAP